MTKATKMKKFTSYISLFYHEMSHASHYTQVGTTWYTQFVNAELAEIVAHPSGSLNPYGDGHSSNSPIIALGEAWAYHMGHFLADQRYGVNASCHIEQPGHTFCPNGTNHPHIDVLENFIPSLTADPFQWIPKGLMEDLMDNGAEPSQTLVTDQVSGFSISQIFSALQSDITTVPTYRARFIQQNPGNQTTQITALFASYNY